MEPLTEKQQKNFDALEKAGLVRDALAKKFGHRPTREEVKQELMRLHAKTKRT